jgi:hypothetical protein
MSGATAASSVSKRVPFPANTDLPSMKLSNIATSDIVATVSCGFSNSNGKSNTCFYREERTIKKSLGAWAK